jgi:TPR repeat protein
MCAERIWNFARFEKSSALLELSVNQRNIVGQRDSGKCLIDELGVSKDSKKAAHYFRFSADQGNAHHQRGYGSILLDGTCASQNL